MVSHSVDEDAGLLEAIDVSSALDLHRSNLLRMQIAELLEECHLDIDSRKWTSETQEYFQLLSLIISKVSMTQRNFQGIADRPVSLDLSPSKGMELSMEPTGCTKARLGWTKKSGNAQVLPTFEFMVRIPSGIFSGKDYMNHRYFDVRK